MEKEFNKGSELDKQIYKEGEPTWGCKYGVLDVEDVKEFIKRNIGCGIDIGGWHCGEHFGIEVDEDGRSLGRTYYCDRCKKLIKESGNKLK